MNEIQNELAGATVALGATITAAMDDAPGFVPCGTPAQVVLDALNAASVAEPEADLPQRVAQVRGFVEHVSGHRGVPAHAGTDVAVLSPTGKQLLDALFGFAASANAETLSQDATSWLYRSLAALETGDDEKVNAQLAAAPRA